MTLRHPAVIAYDVAHNGRRRRLLRLLRGWRIGGQYSVHECSLTRREAEELYIQLCELIEPEEDRLLLAWLDGRRPVEHRGTAKPGEAAPGLLRFGGSR